MHNTLQLLLPFTSIEKDTSTFDMSIVIEFRRHTGMIKPAYEMINNGRAIHCSFNLLYISDFATNDRNRRTKFRARFLFVSCQYPYIQLLFYQLSSQSRT